MYTVTGKTRRQNILIYYITCTFCYFIIIIGMEKPSLRNVLIILCILVHDFRPVRCRSSLVSYFDSTTATSAGENCIQFDFRPQKRISGNEQIGLKPFRSIQAIVYDIQTHYASPRIVFILQVRISHL